MLQSRKPIKQCVQKFSGLTLSFLMLFSFGLPLSAEEGKGNEAVKVKADSENQTPMTGFDLANYKGQFVYLDFWASWCGPCRASFPWMNTMQKDFGSSGFKVVSINLDAEREDADDFLEEFPADFDVIFDPNGKYAESYALLGMPSSYFYDNTGKLLFSHVGFNHKDAPELREKIKSVLNKSK